MSSSMFERFSRACSRVIGHPAFLLGWTVISIAWTIVGLFVGFSDTWQFVLLNPLTVLTFLMLSPLQHSQSTDTAEIKGMLKEIVDKLPGADRRHAMEIAEKEC